MKKYAYIWGLALILFAASAHAWDETWTNIADGNAWGEITAKINNSIPDLYSNAQEDIQDACTSDPAQAIQSIAKNGATVCVNVGEGGGSIVGVLDDLTDVQISDPTAGQSLIYDGTWWSNAVLSGTGNVIGPVTGSTDNAVPVFDGATGTFIKNSNVTISEDGDDVTVPGAIKPGSMDVAKVSGEPGRQLLYEATGTETEGIGWMGPAGDVAAGNSVYYQFSATPPAANSLMLFGPPVANKAPQTWTTFDTLTLDLNTTGTINGRNKVINASGPTDLSGNSRYSGSTFLMTATGAIDLWDCDTTTTGSYLVVWNETAALTTLTSTADSADRFKLDGVATEVTGVALQALIDARAVFTCMKDDKWFVSEISGTVISN